jgi:hypothetical protein
MTRDILVDPRPSFPLCVILWHCRKPAQSAPLVLQQTWKEAQLKKAHIKY